MAAAWNELPATGGLRECAALVDSAEALRVSAPELSVQLARRALLVGATDASAGTTNVGEARHLSMRAQALLASGLVRISQHVKAVEPGFAALALAETGGAPDLAAEVRIDLAACAQQVGEPLLGGAILRPVLDSARTPPSVRAAALGRLVGCVAHAARRDDVEDALAEADRLLAADDGIAPDLRRLERARLAVRTAGYHRWYGDTEDAITAAREGLNLLTRLRSDLRSESDRLRARLVLELVCGLLDEGELGEATNAAHPTVDEPVRATAAASVGRLMLAVATRVYLPGGQMDRGRHLLDQAAWIAERHALDGLRADALTEVSRLDEQAGRASDALEAMRGARAAEHRRMRAVSRAARIVLVEVGANHGIRDTTQQSVAALMRQLAHPAGLPVAVAPAPAQVSPPPPKPAPEAQKTSPATPELAGTVDMDQDNGLLDREGLFRRLRSVRTGERPVALTLVRVEPNQTGDENGTEDRGPDTGIMVGLADKVRDMAPDNAELARSDGGELAVLMPATTRDQAEEFAATIRESDWAAADGKEMSISTGVVHTDQTTTADAAGILTAARDALTPAQPTSADSLADTAAALQSALSEDTPTTPLSTQRPAEQQQTGRSILSSLSIPTGSGGRRRAGEEQPPGAKSRWPAEPAEAPRWTRAERRAQAAGSTWPADQTTPPGFPAPEEEPSQGKRAAGPAKPSFSETRTGETTTGIDRTQLPTHHDTPPSEPTANSHPHATTGLDRAQLPTHHGTPSSEPAAGGRLGSTDSAQLPARHGTSPSEFLADGRLHSTDSARLSARHGTPSGEPAGDGRLDSTTGLDRAQLAAQHGTSPSESAGEGRPHSTDPAQLSARHGTPSGEPAGGSRLDSTEFPARHGASQSAGEGRPHSTDPAQLSARHGTPAGESADDDRLRFMAGSDAARLPSRHGTPPSEPADNERPASESRLITPSTDEPTRAAQEGAAADGERARHGTSSPGAPDRDDLTSSGLVGRRAAAASDLSSPRTTRESARSARSVTSGEDPAAAGSAASEALGGENPTTGSDLSSTADRPALPRRRAAAHADETRARTPAEQDDAGFFSSLAGLSSGGILRGSGERTPERSSYEETKAELARMMSALNAKSLAAREAGARNGQSVPVPPEPAEVPEPPARPDVPAPPEPDPIPPAPEPTPEPGGRSGLMAAFDALTGPVPGLRAEFDDAAELPARRPAESWARLESAGAVESPADKLFGTAPAEKARRSSLGEAFAEFGAPEKKVTEPVKEPVQETAYDEPIGPEPQPADLPRRGERSSATIASLLTEALAAYQSTAEDADSHRAPERFDSFVSDDSDRQQSGVTGRHRSPE